jgi:hypothetical protein
LAGSAWESVVEECTVSGTISTGQSDTGKGAPKTTEQMMQKNTYKYLRNDPQQGLVEIRWDFDTVWDIDEGHSYPFLRELPKAKTQGREGFRLCGLPSEI